MLSVRSDIPCKLLSVENQPVEAFYVTVILRKTKWLLCCSYNGCSCNIDFRKENLNEGLALYPPHYKNFITIRDFNMGVNGSGFLVVTNTYDLKSLNCN